VIAGFLLGNGESDGRIAVRGIGPSLASEGVPNPLPNPTLEIRTPYGALAASFLHTDHFCVAQLVAGEGAARTACDEASQLQRFRSAALSTAWIRLRGRLKSHCDE
jgi:hypothetical protein